MIRKSLLASLFAITLATPLSAQGIIPGDAEAARVLEAVANYYKGLEKVSVTLNGDSVMQAGEEKRESTMTVQLSAMKPNHLRTTLKQDEDTVEVISNDEFVIVDLPPMEAYIQTAAVADFDELFANRETAALSGLVFYQKLLSADPLAAIAEDLKTATLSDATVDGQELDRVTLEYAESTIDLWVEKDDSPALVRMEAMRETGFGPAYRSSRTNVVYTDFNGAAELSPANFTFTPAEGATKVADFREAITLAMSQTPEGPELGVPAPPIDLVLANGEPLTLETHKGKEVVVLDFWATWCPPCREGLPILNKVAADYADKPVRVYAVNLREPKDKAIDYLKKASLENFTLALDEGDTATAYGIISIPTTLVIDRAGNLSALHVGLAPDLEATIKADIDKALAAGNAGE